MGECAFSLLGRLEQLQEFITVYGFPVCGDGIEQLGGFMGSDRAVALLSTVVCECLPLDLP